MDASFPELSPKDGLLIEQLLSHGRSLPALSQSSNTPLHDLLAWITQPHIQHAIDTLTRLELDGHKAAALSTLRQLLDTSEDPKEKRRAATAILRATHPRARATPGGTARSAGALPTNARATGASPASATTPPDPFPAPSPDLPHDNSRAAPPTNARATGGPPASATTSPDPDPPLRSRRLCGESPEPPPEPPLPAPNPTHSIPEMLHALFAAMKARQRSSLQILQRFHAHPRRALSANDFRFYISDLSAMHIDHAHAYELGEPEVYPCGTRAAVRVSTFTCAGFARNYFFQLKRMAPLPVAPLPVAPLARAVDPPAPPITDPGCWLITEIQRHPRSSNHPYKPDPYPP